MPTNSSVSSSVIRGPAQVQWLGCTMWSPGDIAVSIIAQADAIEESSLGEIDQTHDQIHAEIRFVPAGQITQALLNALFPYCQAGWLPGASLRGASDSPLVIFARDGTRYTFPAVVITQQPSLHLGLGANGESTLGPVTFTAFRPGTAPWSLPGSLWSMASVAYPGDALFLATNQLSGPSSATFYSSLIGTYTSLSSPTGFNIEFQLQTNPVYSDGSGLIDLTYGAIRAACSCVPATPGPVSSGLGPTAAVLSQLFNFQGSGAIRGGSRTLASGTLSIAANGLYVKMEFIAISQQEFLFGQKLRQGELVFSQTANASLPTSSSLPQSLVQITTYAQS